MRTLKKVIEINMLVITDEKNIMLNDPFLDAYFYKL